ncbi:MAG TPA: Asp-tRNA(Asn)/Glu-tRNA(Gln) amidotransferase subunit GatC [Pirellulales bacterium]|jgi:aspartyl-tRNA(Asn)/glutamyl-tRNA(Gln) amidotransferase subunit C
MSLTRQEVEKVSLLGRLLLTSDELDRMTSQLTGIVAYIEQLAELDDEIKTQQVQPMAHAVEMTNVFRPDEVLPSLDRADALANAPQHDEQCYLVPAVLGE